MWNVKAYKEALNAVKEEGEFNGKKIRTLEEIYDELADIVHMGRDSIKGWGRPSSRGPGEDSVRLKLEKALNVPVGSFVVTDWAEEKKEVSMSRLSDFNKAAIFKCYERMKEYLHDEDVENENCFYQMYAAIEIQRIAMPDTVYEKIRAFMDDVLAPVIYEREKTFSECYSEEIGYFNEEGNWEVKNEECGRKMCMAFLMKILEIEQKLDEFAMKELRPYLI